jgi:hypothetical protein
MERLWLVLALNPSAEWFSVAFRESIHRRAVPPRFRWLLESYAASFSLLLGMMKVPAAFRGTELLPKTIWEEGISAVLTNAFHGQIPILILNCPSISHGTHRVKPKVIDDPPGRGSDLPVSEPFSHRVFRRFL